MKYLFLLLVLALAMVAEAHSGCRGCDKKDRCPCKWTQWADPTQHCERKYKEIAEGWIHKNYDGCCCFPCGKAPNPCHHVLESADEEYKPDCHRCKRRKCNDCHDRYDEFEFEDNDQVFWGY